MIAPCGPLDEAGKIAVLVPFAVGDFVFTLPALQALRRAYPDAELAVIGREWHRRLLQDRPGPVDRVVVMPSIPGVGATAESLPDPAAGAFLAGLRQQRIDLAVQIFGGGRYSNPLVREFGARLAIGARADDAPPLDRWVRYAVPNNRRLAMLEVAALAGAVPPPLQQELAVTEADRREAAAVIAASRGRPLAVLQPGASDPRRCWPPASFAAVGDALASAGAAVAVNGAAAEAGLVRTVLGHMRQPALDLAGKLSLGGLCGLLDGAALMVSNDTGPLHLALAIGTPSVGIFWFTNLVDGTPLRQHLLRSALSLRLDCPVCGAQNVRYRCPHDPSFVADVPVEQVADMALSLLRERA
ncbi:MAG: glycosyltransferase family 9 protein [Telluria sp.]